MSTPTKETIRSNFFYTTYKITTQFDTIETEYEFNFSRILVSLFLVISSIVVLSNTIYTVEEGNRGVIRTWGEVTSDAKPGLHWKIPFVQSVQNIEIRPRKYEYTLQASTTGTNVEGNTELQMPSTIHIAGNYSVDPDSVKDIVSKYGSIAQFDDRILDPRVRQVVLAEVPKLTIEQVMTDRSQLSNTIYVNLNNKLQNFPVDMTDVMVANVDWHEKIKDAVLKKQNAKLAKEEEQYKLDKQNLEAQQKVNTSRAEAESIELVARAQANATILKGEAEAKAIDAKGKALKDNPGLVKLIHEERWDGKLPQMMLGNGANMLMQVPPLTR